MARTGPGGPQRGFERLRLVVVVEVGVVRNGPVTS